MEEEDLKKQQKQAEQDEASQKTAHVAGKAAATYFGGSAGGKLYDAVSKTKLGQGYEKAVGNYLQKQPGMNKAMEGLNKSGALDAADKGLDLAGGDGSSAAGAAGATPNAVGGGLPTSNISTPNGKSGLEEPTSKKKSSMSSLFGDKKSEGGLFSSFGGEKKQSNSEEQSVSSKMFELIKRYKFQFLGIIGGIVLVFLAIMLVMIVVLGFAQGVTGFFNGIVDFFTTDQQELEQDYYEKLKEVQNKINLNDGVCIDVNLITAALTVNISVDDMLVDGDTNIESEEDTSINDYKKMTKQVELLANMQIRRKKYGWDSRLGNEHCIDSSEDEYELVDSTNEGYFINPAIFGENRTDSSTAELVAQHDLSGFAAFFTKKVNEEKNYAYYLYRPAFTYETVRDINGNAVYNPDGSVKQEKICYDNLDKDSREEPEISIGDLSTKEDSVFYWNLVNSFIPEYYDEYLPNSDPKRTERIKEIADDIYLLYKDIGPNQVCSITNNYICRNDEGADFYGGGETSLDRAKFIENISPVAINEMTRTGIFASITLAQAALESGNGSSKLSSRYSNYYGMTAGSCAPSDSPANGSGSVYQSGEGGNSCKGNSFWNGSVVAMCNSSGGDCQWYRIYDSFENSTKDHSRLLADNYGCNVYGSYSEQLDCIVAHGYATDPKYKNKIISTINSYNLSDYDIGNWDGNIVPVTENQFVDMLCYSTGSASGEFTSWKQYDSAWSNVGLGTSTVGKIGCAMTSVTIQIMRSGVSTSLGADLNPGTFAQKMTSIGGFDKIGNIYWNKVTEIAPDFEFVARISKRATPNEIADLVTQGYYVILNVKNGRHWVAVDRVDDNKIYMFDPGSGGTEVGSTYGLNSIVGYAYYKKG